ncbi:DUF1389 domain-containing protein [Chlamydia caviae]|uniref:Uncharacterized protein n=1 Tax=Chlamydia caviae (strain ATCC VR-813 / DSM 19441 / 03DC25 / GPIC) TaxID=227941 RepID=Q822P3_CHLCV|nr:DUF1389 domain-containing protein [Chlamydia caviae]AAP05378.1 conserved hypothetical protein [Chlamydia caviae GPIC]
MTSLITSHPHLSEVVQKGICSRCPVDKLCKNALRVGSVFCLALSMAFAIALICVAAQPALIICLVISLVLTLVLLAISLRRYIRREFGPSLPEGFLSIIKKEFPVSIYELVVQERLTLQELRVVISGLSSGVFTFPSKKCREKLERFGLERLQSACEGIQLPDLEKILLKNCPLYLLSKFIQLGPKEFPESVNLPPEVYWLSRLGLSSSYVVFFNFHNWVLSQVVTKEEYEILLKHAKDSTWDQIKDLTENLRLRVREGVDNYFVEQDGLTKGMLRSLIGGSWLLYLCKHGVCWEQLQLLKELDCSSVGLMDEFEMSRRRACLMKSYFSISPYANESDVEAFDPHLILFTFREWKKGLDSHKYKKDFYIYDCTMALLRKRSQNTLRECNTNRDIPCLPERNINRETGAIVE